MTLEEQASRSYEQFKEQPDDLSKYVYLSLLPARNEILFYRLVSDHISEMLPIVYTPTIGLAIQRYSQVYRGPNGLYLSIDDQDGMKEAFKNLRVHADDIDLIVATDGERILGIGDYRHVNSKEIDVHSSISIFIDIIKHLVEFAGGKV